jgi:hypothetical protein
MGCLFKGRSSGSLWTKKKEPEIGCEKGHTSVPKGPKAETTLKPQNNQSLPIFNTSRKRGSPSRARGLNKRML